jgi:hypothetical protein
MKQLTIFILFLISVSLHGQSEKTEDHCNLKMTKQAMVSLDFNTIDCLNLEDKKIFQFKFKVPKFKTVSIKGHTLNSEAKSYISKASVGDVIAFFDVTLESEEKMSPILITLIE